MYNPVNPSFTVEKWGLRGSKLYRHVSVMLKNMRLSASDAISFPLMSLMGGVG